MTTPPADDEVERRDRTRGPVRRVIFWLHLSTAVTVALVVLLLAATGVLLTWERQITHRADVRGLDGRPPAAEATPLPPESIIELVERRTGAGVTAVTWRAAAAAPVEVALGSDRTVFVNAYDGRLLGSGSERARAFFERVTSLHRWLALGSGRRATGRAITGAANIAFLFILLSGAVLWWPRRRTRRTFRNAMLFRRGLRPKARDFNLHNVIGIWCLVPLLVIVTSGVVLSYGWAGDLLYRIAGDEGAPPAVPAPAPPGELTLPLPQGVLLERARDLSPGWRTITLELAPPRPHLARYAVDRSTGGQPQHRSRLVLDAATGELLSRDAFDSVPRGRRWRSLLRYAHTGEVFGATGQLVAGAASAGVLFLIWTGIALALRRLAAWRRP